MLTSTIFRFEGKKRKVTDPLQKKKKKKIIGENAYKNLVAGYIFINLLEES
jgi:hypothetical protein